MIIQNLCDKGLKLIIHTTFPNSYMNTSNPIPHQFSIRVQTDRFSDQPWFLTCHKVRGTSVSLPREWGGSLAGWILITGSAKLNFPLRKLVSGWDGNLRDNVLYIWLLILIMRMSFNCQLRAVAVNCTRLFMLL